MKKIGIKKTWGNIIMLFVIGMVVGVVIGLRQPMPQKTTVIENVAVCSGDEPTCDIPTTKE